MIPLTLACIIGGCLDFPIDNRPIHRQILDDQFGRKEEVRKSCYINGKFYKQCPEEDDDEDQYYVGPRDPRVRD